MPTRAPADVDSFDSEVLLQVLSDVKAGDFTARMPLDWTGVAGKVADGLNDVIVANQALGTELGAGQPGRRQAGQAVAARRRSAARPGLVRERRIGQQPDRRPGAPDERDAARDRRGRRRRPEQEGLGRRPRRDARAEEHHQRDGRPAQRLHLRGDPRRPRGRHRGQARPGGRGARSRSAASGRTSPTTST